MTIPFARTTPPHAIRRWPLPTVPSDTIEALRAELEEATDAAARTAAVERFRAHLERERTPLIEPDAEGDTDWCRVTFVFLGDAPNGVLMQLNRISDPLDPEDTTLEQIAGSEVHALTLRLPAAWQGGYLFAVAQSPSLWWPSDPSPWQKPAGWFEERAAAAESDAPGAPILIEAGAIDAGVVEYARSAAALLRTQNALIAYNEYSAGHDILQWQSTLADALATALR